MDRIGCPAAAAAAAPVAALLLLGALPCAFSLSSGVPPEAALLWPKPQRHIIGGTLLRVDADAFLFSVGLASAGLDTTMRVSSSKHPTGTLAEAFERYRAICFPPTSVVAPHTAPGLPVLSGLEVVVASADEMLSMETSEKYSLTIPRTGGNATLTADTVYGALRGLETFSQMLQPDLTILEQSVDDWPRFPFRAVLIDTGRHFLPVSLIEAHIDAMSYNKMNVLHWVRVHTGRLLSSLVHTPLFVCYLKSRSSVLRSILSTSPRFRLYLSASRTYPTRLLSTHNIDTLLVTWLE